MEFGVIFILSIFSFFRTSRSVPVDGSTGETMFEEFKLKREILMRKEREQFLGSNLTLNQDEQFANVHLMRSKIVELDTAFAQAQFLPAKSFFLSRQDIQNSDVFKFIRAMPKGAALHTHHISLGPIPWVIANLTYRSNLYMRLGEDRDSLRFGWYERPPTHVSEDGHPWKNVNEARKLFGDEEFDTFLKEHLTCGMAPSENINDLWNDFKRAVKALHGILMHQPAFKDYLYSALEDMHNDQIQHVQIRTTLPKCCQRMLNADTGECDSPLTEMEMAMAFKEVTEKFEADHKDFCGSSLIICRSRKDTDENVIQYLELAGQLQNVYPDFVVGFDLVGQEDLGRPLMDFAQILINAKIKYPKLKFFFHAGETDWHGTTSDMNLVDAIFLNATRIGHGYSLAKHPEAKKLALEKDIPIEVCPISNQILGLVNDLRNHPAATLIQEGFPMILASDDMGTWEAQGLSDDFYEAFMGMTSKTTDLRFLKKLVFNSIKYSSLSDAKQSQCLSLLQRKWFDYMKKFRL